MSRALEQLMKLQDDIDAAIEDGFVRQMVRDRDDLLWIVSNDDMDRRLLASLTR